MLIGGRPTAAWRFSRLYGLFAGASRGGSKRCGLDSDGTAVVSEAEVFDLMTGQTDEMVSGAGAEFHRPLASGGLR